jgi:hypothetical protein
LIGVIIDIDDTLIDTQPRTHQIMETILNRKIALEDLYTLSQEKIFYKYASETQKNKARELKQQFLDLLLCKNSLGIKLFEYDKPIPFAVDVLQRWKDVYKIIYLTGRLKTIRELTLKELREFGFPMLNTDLIMFDPSDWGSGNFLLEARKRLLYSITTQSTIVRVIDDFPGYFPAYKQVSIPDRIGFCQLKNRSKDDYIKHGATRVIESWEELLDEHLEPE